MHFSSLREEQDGAKLKELYKTSKVGDSSLGTFILFVL
jgi:hypothetical protein